MSDPIPLAPLTAEAELQAATWAAAVPAEGLLGLFEALPEVYVFAKDREGRFLYGNRALLDRLGLQSVSELIGTTDRTRYPRQLADRFAADDRLVMDRGEPLLNRIEVLFDETGRLDWFSTSKFPLRDSENEILGVVGLARSHRGARRLAATYAGVSRALEAIEAHDEETGPLRVGDLARQAGMSERQLHRQFQSALGMSPQEFLLRTRIQSAASRLREGDESIASIAEALGFCDQSAFTRQFRRRLGTTPAAYRRRYRRQA